MDEVMFVDNQPTMDLLTGRLGVFDLLDSECISQHGSDANFLASMQTELKHHKSKAFVKPRVGLDIFAIRHYAGLVEYDAKGFRDKNLDTLPDQIKRVMSQSTSPVVCEGPWTTRMCDGRTTGPRSPGP